jgi:hypothetical protein
VFSGVFFTSVFRLKIFGCGRIVGFNMWINGTNLWIKRPFWGEQVVVLGYCRKNRLVFRELPFRDFFTLNTAFRLHTLSRVFRAFINRKPPWMQAFFFIHRLYYDYFFLLTSINKVMGLP